MRKLPVNKTRIQRVFRDKEELPLVTNLADPITEALENSEYLIVICSPRLPESMWCRKEIEKQYREAKKNTAISKSKEAMNYLEEGDRMRAIATAQDALLDLSEGDGIEDGVDYPAEAIYALTDSLYLYENGQQILPDRILEADTAVRVMKLSPEGSKVLTVDASGQIVVWQPKDSSERIVLDAVYDRLSSGMENKIAFFGEESVFCPVENDVVLYDLSGESALEKYRVSCDGKTYVGMIVLQEQKTAILLTDEWYRAIDCTDGSTVYEEQWDMDGLAARALAECACSEDGRVLRGGRLLHGVRLQR